MAAAGFRVRRVKSENSIGDRLKRTRVRKKISIAEVEESTKIRAKFITALESDSWDLIPSEVYGRGYLETYLDFLKIAKDPVMKQYDKERCLYARNCQDAKIDFTPKHSHYMPRFLITPKTFMIVFIMVAVVGFGSVMAYQLKKFTSAPFLELVSPNEVNASSGEAELIVTTNQVTLAGRTSIGARVLVNNQEVAVGQDGGFREQVNVSRGLNSIVVEANSQNGKKTTEILSVLVK